MGENYSCAVVECCRRRVFIFVNRKHQFGQIYYQTSISSKLFVIASGEANVYGSSYYWNFRTSSFKQVACLILFVVIFWSRHQLSHVLFILGTSTYYYFCGCYESCTYFWRKVIISSGVISCLPECFKSHPLHQKIKSSWSMFTSPFFIIIFLYRCNIHPIQFRLLSDCMNGNFVARTVIQSVNLSARFANLIHLYNL